MAKTKNENVVLERVSINLPKSLVDKVRAYADKLGLPYTQAYVILLGRAIDNEEMINRLPTLINGISEMKALTEFAVKNKDVFPSLVDKDIHR